MANVAGTLATGPASKDAVSSGATFPAPKDTTGSMPRGPIARMNNTSDEARSKIMGMRYGNGGGFSTDTGILSRKPS